MFYFHGNDGVWHVDLKERGNADLTERGTVGLTECGTADMGVARSSVARGLVPNVVALNTMAMNTAPHVPGSVGLQPRIPYGAGSALACRRLPFPLTPALSPGRGSRAHPTSVPPKTLCDSIGACSPPGDWRAVFQRLFARIMQKQTSTSEQEGMSGISTRCSRT